MFSSGIFFSPICVKHHTRFTQLRNEFLINYAVIKRHPNRQYMNDKSYLTPETFQIPRFMVHHFQLICHKIHKKFNTRYRVKRGLLFAVHGTKLNLGKWNSCRQSLCWMNSLKTFSSLKTEEIELPRKWMVPKFTL